MYVNFECQVQSNISLIIHCIKNGKKWNSIVIMCRDTFQFPIMLQFCSEHVVVQESLGGFPTSIGYSSDTDLKLKHFGNYFAIYQIKGSAIFHRTRKCHCGALWKISQRLDNGNGYYGRIRFWTFEFKMSYRGISCIATTLWLRYNLSSHYDSSSPGARQKLIVHL